MAFLFRTFPYFPAKSMISETRSLFEYSQLFFLDSAPKSDMLRLTRVICMAAASSANLACFSIKLFTGCSRTHQIPRQLSIQQIKITLLTMQLAVCTHSTYK